MTAVGCSAVGSCQFLSFRLASLKMRGHREFFLTRAKRGRFHVAKTYNVYVCTSEWFGVG